MFKFSWGYFVWVLLLLAAEAGIAVYIHDNIIRPYFGDFLVVILIYCFVKGLFKTPVTATVIGVLLFAYLVETLQYFHILNVLGLQNYKIACIIMGTNFSWNDIIMYTMGMLLVWLVEVKLLHKPAN
ncbi:DUF2809 domain-containing protein [Mucilaginibacter sp. R11]|uniref:DUF2809 domain-containing protein n=2 Tax=Mucilaginibacter agri TaxID=2695265 RepID=A0A965ZK31_9SPHI|nr:DUF2809 domain-containing protein [Mucilaginibacter agri]